MVSSGSHIQEGEERDIYEFALSNIGNQELLLRDVHVEPENWKEKEGVPVIKTKDVPVVIKPGTVKLLKIPVLRGFISRLASDNRILNFRFEFITPKAEIRNANKTVNSNLELDSKKKSWKPFKLK